jgi:NADH-quinone oxidoreductase subunit N
MENITNNLSYLIPEILIIVLGFTIIGVGIFTRVRNKFVLPFISVTGLIITALFIYYKFDFGNIQTLSTTNHNQMDDLLIYGGLLKLDSFSLLFKFIFIIIGIFITLMSIDYVVKYINHEGEYYGLIVLSIAGMMIMAAANELLTAYIGLELLSFSLYILVSLGNDPEKTNESSIKYILLGGFTSALVLYGISQIYTELVKNDILNPTFFTSIGTYASQYENFPPLFIFGLFLLITGLGFKIAAVPFHTWAPDIYEGAPLPIAAYLATASKVAGIALILRIFSEVFEGSHSSLIVIVAILAILTMSLGNITAIAQTKYRRLIAYSGISHMGYILVGLATDTVDSYSAIIFHSIGYIFSSLVIFSVLVCFYNKTNKDNISDLSGLYKTNSFLALGITIALLSTAGLPFFVGFISKFYLFLAAVAQGLLWLVIIALINSLISLYYYLMVIKEIYVGTPINEQGISTNNLEKFIVVSSLIGVIGLGLYPEIIMGAINSAAIAVRIN